MRNKETYIVALDQGTTSSRALLINRMGQVVGTSQIAFKQYFPKPGWVEHDPKEIVSSQLAAMTELMIAHNLSASNIEALAIANQRETTIVWDKRTGEPIYNAIVWQCRRTAAFMEAISENETVVEAIREKTGLVPDAYFSASKIAWILDHVPGARENAEAGNLAFGTVDTWLLWALTHGRVHATDYTNASRTLLFNIHDLCWDPYLLDLFGIPESMLPEVHPSAFEYGTTSGEMFIPNIPICGIAGDQQAALFGQCCFEAGEAKNTYGTGCFLLMHTGKEACESSHQLITTIAASAPSVSQVEYALEGSVFMGGALMQWLRDELKLMNNTAESEAMALSVADTAGVVIVPAFTGLGAPHWESEARGMISGLTRGVTAAHIVRAALESIAFQVYDLAKAMEADAQEPISVLKVDGGASNNDFLMQFQADLLQCELRRPQNKETTALGAAYLAGLYTGFWKDMEELRSLRSTDDVFFGSMEDAYREMLLDQWNREVIRCLYDAD